MGIESIPYLSAVQRILLDHLRTLPLTPMILANCLALLHGRRLNYLQVQWTTSQSSLAKERRRLGRGDFSRSLLSMLGGVFIYNFGADAGNELLARLKTTYVGETQGGQYILCRPGDCYKHTWTSPYSVMESKRRLFGVFEVRQARSRLCFSSRHQHLLKIYVAATTLEYFQDADRFLSLAQGIHCSSNQHFKRDLVSQW